MAHLFHKYELDRMIGWLAWGVLFHVIALALRHHQLEPQLQTLAWKLGNLTFAAYAGYWIDRRTFLRVRAGATSYEQVRRAIIMAAAMITVGLGL